MSADFLQDYLRVINAERSWSWSVIGIVYLVLALMVRSVFLGPVIRKARDLNRSPHHEFRSAYLKRSPLGWVFFLISFLTVIGLWSYGARLPVSIHEALAVLGAIVSLNLSILCHLQAIALAAIIALKRTSEKELGN